MIKGIDLLARLLTQACTVSQLSGVVNGSEEETKQKLDDLLTQGWVSEDPAVVAGITPPTEGLFTITLEGRAFCEPLLDQFAVEPTGPPSMTVLQRFVTGLLESVAPSQRQPLLAVYGSLPPEQTANRRREHAVLLARRSVGYAQIALEADERAAGASALGLKSLPLGTVEDLGYAACLLRDSYAPSTNDGRLRTIVEQAAASCEAVFGLRSSRPGVSRMGIEGSGYPDSDLVSCFEVADHAAGALLALASAGLGNVVAEVHEVSPPCD